MVSFRFYIVATVALFLALAVGIVVGSALNDAIVPSLKERIARVESNLDDSVTAMQEHKRQIDDFEKFAKSVAPYAVGDRLDGTATFVVAEPGASEDDVKQLVATLDDASSEVDGVVWLTQRWKLTKAEDRARQCERSDQREEGKATQVHFRAPWWERLRQDITSSVRAPTPSPRWATMSE